MPTTALLFLNLILLLVLIGLTFYSLRRNSTPLSEKKLLDQFNFILDKALERTERNWHNENALNRKENRETTSAIRQELSNSSKDTRQELNTSLKNFADSLEKKFNTLSSQVEVRLGKIQQDNTVQLDKMRQTVDEKLGQTLDRRLKESFSMVSENLTRVQKGLGEMQQLATGVGDLKKVLTNVKTRGTWGEVQLGNLLEQVLAQNQYQTNVAIKKTSNDRVEFAILLPNRDDPDNPTFLPIDAKFPVEDYHRLIDAQEKGDLPAIDSARKALIARIKLEAKKIADKYLDPPRTTDYAFMYLPTEGLFAEVTQVSGLTEQLQTQYRITVAGPTTILATLNSLQIIFRTLAIQERSGEVWHLLEQIKTEFSRFGLILEKTQKKLQEASNTIESAAKKSRTISRKLNKVALPANTPSSQPEEQFLLESEFDDEEAIADDNLL